MSVLNNIFKDTMKRENKIVSIRDTEKHIKCFFRQSNDNLNRKDSMIMFYAVDEPVRVGSLVTFGENTYLVLNKETAENDVYFKSAVIRSNGLINTHNLSVIDLPCWCDHVNNATTSTTSNFNLIDGNIELLTTDSKDSRELKIDDTFNEWGRTWKISNLFYVDGICHIIAEVTATIIPKYDYELVLSGLTSFVCSPEDTASLKATALCNGIKIKNASITYSSSNPDVASIDSLGNIKYRSAGEVYFEARWMDQNISNITDTVLVLDNFANDNISIHVDQLDEICYDFPETLNFYVMRGKERDNTIPISFKIENISVEHNHNVYLKKIIINKNDVDTIELTVNGSTMLGKTFDLVAYNDEYRIENRQKIKVVSLF